MKRTHILLLCILLLLAILAGAGHFLLKPSLEREFADRVNAYFTQQGLVPEKPIETTVSPLTRTLTIHPFTIRSNPALRIKKGTFEEAQLTLTWQGLLAFSPFESLVPKTGQIPLLAKGRANGLTLSVEDAEIAIHNTTASKASIDALDLETLKAGKADILRTALSVEAIHLDTMTITVPAQDKLVITLGPIEVTHATKDKVGMCVIENLDVTENAEKRLSLKKITQKNIRLYTEEEWTSFAQTISRTSPAAAEAVFDLLMGETPLVESTVLEDITVHVENTPLNIGSITFNTKKNAEQSLFSIARVTLPTKDIEKELEEQTGQTVPLPPVLHLTFSLSSNKDADKNYRLAGNIDIEELLSIDASLNAGISTLKNLEKEIQTCPLKNLRLRVTDKSLLSRAALVIHSNGSAKDFLKKEVAGTGLPKLEAKLHSFIDKPGSIELATKPEKSFTAPQLASMSEEQIFQSFTLTVTQGSEDLDEQVARYKVTK